MISSLYWFASPNSISFCASYGTSKTIYDFDRDGNPDAVGDSPNCKKQAWIYLDFIARGAEDKVPMKQACVDRFVINTQTLTMTDAELALFTKGLEIDRELAHLTKYSRFELQEGRRAGQAREWKILFIH